VLVFDPVTTTTAVIRTKEPPNELFARALPLTLGLLMLDAVFASTFAGLERQTLAPGGGA
jgi:hypothetical protein